jgi:peptidylprolyl isomerase
LSDEVIVKLSAARCAALLLLPVLVLAGCGEGEGGDGTEATAKSGVSASGGFGEKPTLTVPEGTPPAELVTEVLKEGDGAEVKTGETLIANYLGQTWKPKDGKPNVFDNSYDRKQPVGFPIGNGSVIKGWDEALVGQKVGSRVLLTIPAAKAYGATASDSNELAGQDLVFVVDIVDSLGTGLSAKGEEVEPTVAGLPTVKSASGTKPAIESAKGVKPGKAPVSDLLVKGTGEPIDENKALALQIVQADATGKVAQDTWSKGVQVVPAKDVLSVVTALKGQPVGSRAVAVSAGSDKQPGVILLLDVVGQY